MKAVFISEKNGQLQLNNTTDYPMPEIINPHHILIKTKAATINPIDLQMFEGKNESRLLKSDILGRELSGIVAAVGKKVTNFKQDDEVLLAVGSMGSNGAFAEYVVVPEEIVAHKPEYIPFEIAATLPIAYVTAWQTAERLKQPKGSSILILGASGSVGKALVNVLHHFGYYNIVATAGNGGSRAELERFGLKPEKIVSYNQSDLYEHLMKINDNNFYDIVIDSIGKTITETGARVLKREGIFVDITLLRTNEASYILFQKAAVIFNIARYAEPELHYKYGEILRKIATLSKKENWPLQEAMLIGELSSENIFHSFNLLKENKTNGKKMVLTVS